MTDFAIDFDHTDDQTPSFAARCGCARCERFRRNADLAGVNAAAAIVEANAMARGHAIHAAAATAAATNTPIVVPVAAPVFCTCPAQTRPLSIRGVCPACNLRRRPVQPPASVAQSAESQAAANALGVQTDTRTATGTREILTPREQVSREVAEKIRLGRPALVSDLRKWDTLLRSTTEITSANPNGHVRHTEVVAGAKVDGSGIFLGFGGLGQLTRATLAAVCADARVPQEWLPAAKSAHAQAGRVVGELSRLGYIVRSSRVPKRAADDASNAPAREWRARWTVGTAQGGANVGDSFGQTVLTVTLTASDELKIEGVRDLADRVRTDFDAAIAGEIYAAADVSSWLVGILLSRFRAARIGGNWYIRQRYAAGAEQLCTVLSKRWGRDWLLPAIPMSTTEQLCAGLAKNFIAEADAVMRLYVDERDEAQKSGKAIGSRRAVTLHGEIRLLAERASGFAMMLGDRHIAELRTKLSLVANEIAESIDGTTQRFELIFDELRREDESGIGR